MTNIASKQGSASRSIRMLLGSLLVIAAQGWSGCGGGGGSGSGGMRLTSIAPATGPFIGGLAVTIHGAGFEVAGPAPTVVKIGGQLCTDVVTVDESTITCITPAGTPGLAADVLVTTSRGSAALPHGFRYFDAVPVRSDLNGDGIADMVVACPLDDSAGLNAGGVVVFFGSLDPSGLLDRTAADADVRLMGQNSGDAFGTSVCAGDVDGDGRDDLIVGACLADVGSVADAGAVYVFCGPFTSGTTLPAIAADMRFQGEAASAGDRFGTVVELGDVDADGVLDLCASAPLHDHGNPAQDPSGLDRGCLYVFHGGAGLSSRSAALADHKLDGTRRNDRLGCSVAFGDFDADGVDEMAIGSAFSDPSTPILAQSAGVVFVVPCNDELPDELNISSAPMVFAGEEPADRFGTTLAAGDVDGDGIDDLVVGAPSNDYYEYDGGRVYVFSGNRGFASREARLADVKLSGMPTHNSFGQALRVTDLNGDGTFDLLIGAPHADYFNDGNGRAYLFLGGPALVDEVAVSADAMFNGENSQDDQLGTALSVVDINGDHIADLVMSAARNSFGAGRVYLFLSPAHGQHLAANADVQYSGMQAEGLFGAAVAEGQ